MSRKTEYSQEVKLEIIREYMKGNVSSIQLARRYGCNDKTIRDWTAQYKSQGEDTLREIDKNQTYSGEFKQMVVEEYMRGEMGLIPLAIKYKLRSKSQILNWLTLYNGHEKLKS
jgi:transposase